MNSNEETDAPDTDAGSLSGRSHSPEVATRTYRRVFIAAGVLLLLVSVSIAYLVIDGNKPEKPPVPTAAVTYEITGKGTADIAYLARSVHGKATALKAVPLPWKKVVRVPLGKEPTIHVQLSGQGGEARCTLAIRGEHVQRATAVGPHGRATCAAAELTPGRQ